jgi:hypothetical protein
MREKKILLTISYIFFMAITAIIFVDMFRIIRERHLDFFAINSPTVYAALVGGMMTICLVISLITELKGKRADRDAGEADSEEQEGGRRSLMVLLLFSGLLLYTFLMREFGFLIVTPIFLFVLMFLLCDAGTLPKRLMLSAGGALAMTFILYFVFSEIFAVLLP